MGDAETTVEAIMRIIAEDYEIDPAKVKPDSLIMDGRSLPEVAEQGPIDTLGLDSLDYIELIMKLEETFGVSIDPNSEDIKEITTPAKAAAAIDKLIAARAPF
tara:strand:- start:427 stop:735 length:309 start_codon:yes stop_codon:yes gene_type:complete